VIIDAPARVALMHAIVRDRHVDPASDRLCRDVPRYSISPDGVINAVAPLAAPR